MTELHAVCFLIDYYQDIRLLISAFDPQICRLKQAFLALLTTEVQENVPWKSL